MDLQSFLSWLELVFGMAAGLAVIVSPLVALVKTTAGDALPSRYYPIIAVAIGMVLAQGMALLPLGITIGPVVYNWGVALLVGPVAGLIAANLFAWGKGTSPPAPTVLALPPAAPPPAP